MNKHEHCKCCEKNRKDLIAVLDRTYYAERERDLYRRTLETHGICVMCLGTGYAGGFDHEQACEACAGGTNA